MQASPLLIFLCGPNRLLHETGGPLCANSRALDLPIPQLPEVNNRALVLVSEVHGRLSVEFRGCGNPALNPHLRYRDAMLNDETPC